MRKEDSSTTRKRSSRTFGVRPADGFRPTRRFGSSWRAWGEESIATLCRKEGLAPDLYYRWSKEFLEAGKKRLVGDTSREATAPEVTDLRKENARVLVPHLGPPDPPIRTPMGIRHARSACRLKNPDLAHAGL
jgi:hypothetical protein